MSIELTVLFIFIIILAVISIMYRKSALKDLKMVPEENILFEEDRVKVRQEGSPKGAVFFNCRIIVTDKRIIIAQKVPLMNRYMLRHVITYDALTEHTDLPETFRKGYLIIRISREDVTTSAERDHCAVKITIPESALTKGQFIKFDTKRGQEYFKIFQ